ncbi:hypothetical protein [Terasakiella pusilla]|uniref:hypothetical protein n=1 Tax=Terasakiella pusilla TaxID=64973 RepID=UPI003AA90801
MTKTTKKNSGHVAFQNPDGYPLESQSGLVVQSRIYEVGIGENTTRQFVFGPDGALIEGRTVWYNPNF